MTESKKNKIKFRDLPLLVKVSSIVFLIYCSLWIIAFILGLVIGFSS